MDKYDLVNYFNDLNLSKEQKKYIEDNYEYIKFHHVRYHFLLSKVIQIRKTIKKRKIVILDIGPSLFTLLLENMFKEDEIYSLGFDDAKLWCSCRAKFIAFDLNDSVNKNKWPKFPKCDIVIFSEVIEHLYTAPVQTLNFIYNNMSRGYLLIQTPNAASLIKRLRLLFGINPYNLIRENMHNPGHYREYIGSELIMFAKESRFKVENISYNNYFYYNTFLGRTYSFFQRFMFAKLRDGITLILKKS